MSAALAGTTRLALLVGANEGGPGREVLRYAERDAEAMRQVLVELGGVDGIDAVLLRSPDPEALRLALVGLDTRARSLKASGERVEVVLYYSGHSDADSLLLGGGRLPFSELRSAFHELGADTGLLVLDSCASGAFVRPKGGELLVPLWDDAAQRADGRAVVTSSSATEASQESDRLGGSFFTVALVTGLRGAADRDADRRVTLTEAYDYAFDATRSATAGTLAGTQHPTREVQLVGSGDLVVTDLRTPQGVVTLEAALAGRLFVRDAEGRLVVEVAKSAGQPLQLHLPDGPLSLTLEAVDAQYAGQLSLVPGLPLELSLDDLQPVRPRWTRARGDGAVRPPTLWIATGATLGIAAVSGIVAAREADYYPWYPADTPTGQIASATFVVSTGLGTALLVGAIASELRRDR